MIIFKILRLKSKHWSLFYLCMYLSAHIIDFSNARRREANFFSWLYFKLCYLCNASAKICYCVFKCDRQFKWHENTCTFVLFKKKSSHPPYIYFHDNHQANSSKMLSSEWEQKKMTMSLGCHLMTTRTHAHEDHVLLIQSSSACNCQPVFHFLNKTGNESPLSPTCVGHIQQHMLCLCHSNNKWQIGADELLRAHQKWILPLPPCQPQLFLSSNAFAGALLLSRRWTR